MCKWTGMLLVLGLLGMGSLRADLAVPDPAPPKPKPKTVVATVVIKKDKKAQAAVIRIPAGVVAQMKAAQAPKQNGFGALWLWVLGVATLTTAVGGWWKQRTEDMTLRVRLVRNSLAAVVLVTGMGLMFVWNGTPAKADKSVGPPPGPTKHLTLTRNGELTGQLVITLAPGNDKDKVVRLVLEPGKLKRLK